MSDFFDPNSDETDEGGPQSETKFPKKRERSFLERKTSENYENADRDRQSNFRGISEIDRNGSEKKRQNLNSYWSKWYHEKGGKEKLKEKRDQNRFIIDEYQREKSLKKQKWNDKYQKEKQKHQKWKKRFRTLKKKQKEDLNQYHNEQQKITYYDSWGRVLKN